MSQLRLSALSMFAVRALVIVAGIAVCFPLLFGQQATSNTTVVPTVINFRGTLTDSNAKPIISTVGVTFLLYANQEGGSPLWMETQNVQPDKLGHYSVMLGSTTSQGLPPSLFADGQARWLGAQVQGQEEQRRVVMVSVPYALKALDAQTLDGKPASAFMAAANASGPNSGQGGSGGTGNNPPVGGGGTRNYIAVWTSSSNLGNSVLYQNSAGTKVGLATATPAYTLDVEGGGIVNALSSYYLGGQAFAFGVHARSNAFLGFAGNSTMTGKFNTATGMDALSFNTTGAQNTAYGNEALLSNTTGSFNTASGMDALFFNTTGGGNTAHGAQALQNNTTGSANTGVGGEALFANTTGIDNTAVGLSALQNNTTGGGNTGVGDGALYSNATGNDNTVIGNSAFRSNTTGSFNTAIGTGALSQNTTGNYNSSLGYGAGASTNLSNTTAIGANAVVSASNSLVLGGSGANAVNVGIGTATPAFTLDVEGTGVVNVATSFNLGGQPFAFGSYPNQNAFLGFSGNFTTTGTGNTATGYQALLANTTGYGNVASGYQALFANTTGQTNTAAGFQALYSSTSGVGNTADGNGALYTNTTGSFNTASGRAALFYNTTGSYNTGLGVDALANNTTGQDNTACGLALVSNTTGNSNVACGNSALGSNSSGGGSSAFGYEALGASTTGSYNTASGDFALYSNTTGNYNTALGYNAGPDSTSTNLTNTTAIGANAVVSQSNALILGGSGANAVNVGIGTATPSNVFSIAQGAGQAISDGWTTYSSRRWKTNIRTLHGALGKVEQLRGVSYDLKANGKHELGVIAEEVGAVVPEIVTWDKNGKNAQSVDYSRLTALLIEATKQQQGLIQKLKAQIKMQQTQMEAERMRTEARFARLTSQVKVIQASLQTNGGNGGEVRNLEDEASLLPTTGVQ